MFKVNKLKKMGGDSLSFKMKIIKADMEYVTDNIYQHICNLDYDSRYFSRFCIDIYLSNEKSNKKKKIGFISGRYFTPDDYIQDELTFLEITDDIGEDIFDLAEEITGENEDIRPEIAKDLDTIAFIEEFYIEKQFRNSGIGSYVLSNLRELFWYYARECITHYIVLPQPRVINHNRKFQNVSDANKDKYILETKVHHFYIKNGFEYIENSKYMLKK